MRGDGGGWGNSWKVKTILLRIMKPLFSPSHPITTKHFDVDMPVIYFNFLAHFSHHSFFCFYCYVSLIPTAALLPLHNFQQFNYSLTHSRWWLNFPMLALSLSLSLVGFPHPFHHWLFCVYILSLSLSLSYTFIFCTKQQKSIFRSHTHTHTNFHSFILDDYMHMHTNCLASCVRKAYWEKEEWVGERERKLWELKLLCFTCT